MRWPVVGLVALLVACGAPASDSPAERVADATLTGWASMDLPEPHEACHVERFQIERPATEAAYLSWCKRDSNACFKWRLVTPAARAIEYPAAIVRPGLEGAVVERLAVHELLHGLVYCTPPWSLDDPYDAGHVTPLVWGKSESAEAVAIELLGAD